jgi:hypothetical protein
MFLSCCFKGPDTASLDEKKLDNKRVDVDVDPIPYLDYKRTVKFELLRGCKQMPRFKFSIPEHYISPPEIGDDWCCCGIV